MMSLPQLGREILLNRGGRGGACVTPDHITLRIDEKLGEVPLDALAAEQSLGIFFQPLIESIPLFATAPALIVVGILMTKCLKLIDWEDPTEAIPACMTLASIPLTYSVASGIAIGFISYPLIKLFSGRGNQTSPLLWVMAALFAMKFITS